MRIKKICRFLASLFFRVFRGKKYAELKKFKSYNLYEPGLERYLKNFQKPGIKHDLSFKDFFLYYSYGYGSLNFNGVYSDALYTLVLTHKSAVNEDVEMACISFEVVNLSTILVKQIQGVSGMLPFLYPFRWEKMMLNIVIDWAKNAGFKSVRVIKAESSGWYREHRAKSLFMKYDVTARRSGFKFDEKDQTYVKALA